MCTQFFKSSLNHPIARKRPLRTLYRYVKWQALSRLTGNDLEFTIAGKAKFVSRRGWPVSNAAYYYGLSEFETMTFLLHFLREGELFVDVGAHIGTYSVLVAALTKARVIAFEPNPEAHAFLTEHVMLNGLEGSVEVHKCALGDEEGELQMTADLGLNNYLDPNGLSDHVISTSVRTLDAMCEEIPAAIKIDVEGFELMVLQGADQILRDPALKVICIETMDLGERYGHSDEEVMQAIDKYGFVRVNYMPFEKRVVQTNKKSGMAICVRDLDYVRNRVANTTCEVISAS